MRILRTLLLSRSAWRVQVSLAVLALAVLIAATVLFVPLWRRLPSLPSPAIVETTIVGCEIPAAVCGRGEPLVSLEVKSRSKMLKSQNEKIEFRAAQLVQPTNLEGRVLAVSLAAQDFWFAPSGEFSMPATQVRPEIILLKPREAGPKRILVHAELRNPTASGQSPELPALANSIDLDIEVLEDPVIVGLTEGQLKALQTFSAVIGLPALALALLNLLVARFERSRDDDRPTIVVP